MRTAKKQVLIIDDEVSFGNLLRLNLEAMGEYDVSVASSGEEGLAIIKQQLPDLVLLDMLMPGGMNGLETLRAIKQIAPELPIAMLTANWNEEEAKVTFSAGAYEYLTKPVDMQRLQTALLVKLF